MLYEVITVKVIRKQNSGGPARPRNIGIRASDGELIALCDGDDIMEPDAIAEAVKVFTAMPDVALVWGDFDAIDDHGNLIGMRWSNEYTSFRPNLEVLNLGRCYRLPANAAYAQLLNGLFLGTSSRITSYNVCYTKLLRPSESIRGTMV